MTLFCTLIFAVLLATFAQWLTSITLVRLSLCKVKGSPNVRRLRIKVLEVFEAFQQTAQPMRSFMRQTVKQIAYKYCINFAKTEFPYRI